MKQNNQETIPMQSMDEPPPPPAVRASIWSARRRRPVFLIALVIGLVLFLVWLPGEAKALLWLAFSAQRGLVILLFLFAMVTLSMVWTAKQGMDTHLFIFLNTRVYPKWLDSVMWLMTQLGNMLAAFIAAFLFFILNFHRLAIEIILGTLTLWLLVETIKALIDRDRPFLALEKTRVIGWKEIGRSFPSGHTSQIFFLMTLLSRYFQIGIIGTIALYAVATIIGLTRIYVGAHYPRDVFAGLVLGSVWGILAMLLDPYWHVAMGV